MFFLLIFQIHGGASAAGSPPGEALVAETTMLMFVGEDLDVLSIASRREERVDKAPAVARVILGETLRENGSDTLGKALQWVPGFYMAQKEWGSRPYLRGIPDSVLFLYDSVPVESSLSNALPPMDNELSLASVKRIEIIQGPGSVLWGADAFAGIVNVVPMTGKDLDGSEIGVTVGSTGEENGAYLNLGHDAGDWDAFFSMSYREVNGDGTRECITDFWNDGLRPTLPENRWGNAPDTSRYFEASTSISLEDLFVVSARFSDYVNPYVLSDTERGVSWYESRDTSSGFIKVDGVRELDQLTSLRFSGSFSRIAPGYEVVDKRMEQEERTLYGEFVLDRSFFKAAGLFTAGVSLKKMRIDNAVVWDGYLPDYLKPDNTFLLPIVRYADTDGDLRSIFGQYRHKIRDVDFWLGVRSDAHSSYKDQVSFNTGVTWTPSPVWVYKIIYGNAYRTPYARQFVEVEDSPDLENITSLNLQALWKPLKEFEAGVCLFSNKIQDHGMEDPYAGASEPSSQRIEGVTLETVFSLFANLKIGANLTLMQHSGPDELYRYNDYSYMGEDGEIIKHYIDLYYPYDVGPENLFNLTATWTPVKDVSLAAGIRYAGSRDLIYPRTENIVTVPGMWLGDLTAVMGNFPVPGVNLEIAVRNLFNEAYETPGTYSTITGEPFSVRVMLSKRW
ncbi:TonB-dependent receptor plug domain-containing protein [Desulforapulum autotrophicum]|uniref:TonB-dependent receptor plug domain-containing protein n=1 Tax=Desulforapulum autotrophicum TaxID=2296 RepID=UPI001E2F94AA|nr:TonB-dependent receptor [Desulforapulum autotrophicum]